MGGVFAVRQSGQLFGKFDDAGITMMFCDPAGITMMGDGFAGVTMVC